MSLIHSETIKVSLSEEKILKILEEHILDKFYSIKYNSFNLSSAIFDFDETGNIKCEIVYRRIIKEEEDT